ncbi:nickel pincer cofactor biosynthesis protein LarB [Candidatus Bathyarchaeota archaeon]|nr:nickel pincer cofactor biosynthesis protein LarB [Candidatus Bathyarchaeota archaeon]
MSREVLEKLLRGEISIDEAEKLLKVTAISEIGNIAKLDVNREIRKGIPEIILAEGKTVNDLTKIALTALEKKGRVIISRANSRHIKVLKRTTPLDSTIHINEKAGVIVLKKRNFEPQKTGGKIGILTAGTSDIPVAEEAKTVAEEMGCEVVAAYDVGVAGIHRLFLPLKEMIEKNVDVIIAVAGREGALPSVVAGMVDVPVIGVPTSVSYGLGEKGVSALIAMLQACPLGLAVVNIDSGVAAGSIAALIANRIARAREAKG